MARTKGLGLVVNIVGSVAVWLVAKVFGMPQTSAFLLLIGLAFVSALGWVSWIVADSLRKDAKSRRPDVDAHIAAAARNIEILP